MKRQLWKHGRLARLGKFDDTAKGKGVGTIFCSPVQPESAANCISLDDGIVKVDFIDYPDSRPHNEVIYLLKDPSELALLYGQKRWVTARVAIDIIVPAGDSEKIVTALEEVNRKLGVKQLQTNSE